jgi:hypothetical protein
VVLTVNCKVRAGGSVDFKVQVGLRYTDAYPQQASGPRIEPGNPKYEAEVRMTKTVRYITPVLNLILKTPAISSYIGLEKVKVLNCHAMKTYGGVEIWLHAFLFLALDKCELSAHAPGPLPLGIGSPVPTA